MTTHVNEEAGVLAEAGDPATGETTESSRGGAALLAPLLVAGIFLGPAGLAILSPAVLATAGPALPLAMAVLAAPFGLEPWPARRPVRRLASSGAVAAAAVLALTTLALLGAGTIDGLRGSMPWSAALVGGVCAAFFVTAAVSGSRVTTALRDPLGYGAALVGLSVGAVAFAAARGEALDATAAALVQALCATVLLAGAGWLLVRDARSPVETRVFVLSTLLLIGGAADLTATSALACGLVAGLAWRGAGGPAVEAFASELRFLGPPFAALVLLVSGAQADVTATTVAFGVIYGALVVATRRVANALGTRGASPQSAATSPRVWDVALLGPAFALAVLRAVGGDGPAASMALSTVVVGTVLGELVAWATAPVRSA